LHLGQHLRHLLGLTVVLCPRARVVITAYWDQSK
jgi:hypothetical protein